MRWATGGGPPAFPFHKEAGVRGILAALALMGLTPGASAAQRSWGLGLEVGIERFWGASGPLAGADEVALRPYRPTHIAIRVDRGVGPLRVALNARYARSAVAGEYEGGATVFTDGFTVIELAPEAAVALVGLGAGAAVRAFAGPVLRLWLPPEESARTRLGARGGLELEASLGTRVSAITRLHGGIAASALDDADVPPGYEVRPMPSAGVALGIRLGL
jgi:hypothetical protein